MRNRPRARCGAMIGTGLALALLVSLAGAPALQAAAESKTSSKAATAQPVDINSATLEQLTTVPGIGPSLAQRIIEFREKQGPFQRIEDLLKIRGIGERSLEKIRPHVKVGRSG